ncbi:MAG: carbohydrate ABC transporter permease [Ornithinimicrobium sp.]
MEGLHKKPRSKSTIVIGVTAWLVGLLFVTPVLWMVLTSFHAETAAATRTPNFFAPLVLDGYRSFMAAGPWPPMINSASASLISTVLVILLAFPAAYALSIKRIDKWTDVMFFFLSTKMLPIVAAILPLYLIFLELNMLDNIVTLILMYTAMNMPIAIWMLQSFLAEVPVEMLEAAQIDGAGLPRTLISVIAPVVMPGIAAAALICFIFSWNELLLARVLTSTVAGTAPVFLTGFVTSQGLFLAQVCAASVVISLPVLVAGFAAQDKLVQGLSMGAVK